MVDVRGLDPRFAPSNRLSSVRFLTYTGEEIKNISCKRITNPITLDSLSHPNTGGLYDPALGPSNKHDLCGTCGLNYVHCPGHMGHIALPLPVYHPMFFMHLFGLLRCTCWNCHRFICTPVKERIFIAQLELIGHGLVMAAETLEENLDLEDIGGGGEGADHSLLEKIENYVQTCKRQASAATLKWKTKHVMEAKNQKIASFSKMCNLKLKTCEFCSAPIRSLRQEGREKLFLRGLQRKSAMAWKAAHATHIKKQKITEAMQAGGEERDEDEEDEGEEGQESQDPTQGLSVEQLMKQCYMSPLEVRDHIRQLWRNNRTLLSKLVGCSMADSESSGPEFEVEMRRSQESATPDKVFFLDVIPVPPSRFRPISQLGEQRYENPQTTNLHRVLTSTIEIQNIMMKKKTAMEEEKKRLEEGGASETSTSTGKEAKEQKKRPNFSVRLQIAWDRLQTDVNCLMDSSLDKKTLNAPSGIKQILEKKEGLFRKHMMGKRVDFSARSVISPDPYIDMDEIGIPMVFAKKLTYPQSVTHWNVNELRQAVINGPSVHPGATHVQFEDGGVCLLQASNSRQRVALAKKLLTPSKDGNMGGASKKVFRHLKNGDILLVNRQPTLHKPSIMAHKARVLPKEKTLRLHYGNCKSYNADFDGDEMNAHFPQNELARAEGYNIVSTHHQYLVPKDGTPLSGLIQDHVVAGVLMTLRGRMFSRQDYMHLVFCSLPNHKKSFKAVHPCILKPSHLWSGKQVVSTILLNIVPDSKQRLNLISKAKISVTEWCRGSSISKWRKKLYKKMKHSENAMTESEVIFCDGELMCGVLEKSQFGASQYGFVHSCYELYGGAVANQLLSALGRLFTSFLQLHGFTLGVEDILVLPEADKVRRKLMSECSRCGPEAAAEALGVENPEDKDELQVKFETAHRSPDSSVLKALDYFMKKKTDHFNNAINTVCVPAGLHKPFPSNCLQLMVQSGAKGSTVNCMQISCLLGQIELEGQRPPLMLSGRFLPSFLPYDASPRAGGFVDGRFLTGIRPQEYFFHCMAGREGLVDTAVKTSRSGYLQRCLIKHLEGLCVAYDLTVRDSDGSVVQFLYGEDGMDISKTRFLNEKQFPFLVNNYQTICDQLDPQSALSMVDSKKAVKYQEKVNRWQRSRAPKLRPYFSGFQYFSSQNIAEVQTKYSSSKLLRKKKNNFKTKVELELMNSWYGLPPMGREKLRKKFAPGPIPVNCHLSPDRYFGSVSTEIYHKVHSFIDKHPEIFEMTNQSDVISQEQFVSLVNFKCLRALANPGESVGLLAAQSIGEPSTQMTLNTFHFAGRGEMNVTLGIPRLREILMTASRSIKTPSMDVPLLPGPTAQERGEGLKRKFTKVKLSQVLEKVEVWERVVKHKDGYRHREYTILLHFLPHHYYKDDFEVSPDQVLEYIENVFLKKLAMTVNKEIKLIKKKRSESVAVEKDLEANIVEEDGDKDKGDPPREEKDSKPSQDAAEEEDSELSGEEDESAGATSAKLLSKKQQHASYEGPGESDNEDQELSEDSLLDDGHGKRRKEEEEVKIEDTEDSDDDICSISDDSDSVAGSVSKKTKINEEGDMYRIRNVLCRCGAVVNYSYDTLSSEWCQAVMKFDSLDVKVMMPTIIERLSAKCVIQETPHINKGYLVQDDSSKAGKCEVTWHVKTDGVNLHELWKHEDVLDLTKVYTNDIHAMAEAYGIEAAYQAIIKEISGVFKVYGIHVDHRHLSLIADYMTFEGSYKPFNRVGMETNSSPFQKMSFETTLHFLQNATLGGECDHILSPSACLVAGRVVKGGTGSFELMQKLC